MFFEYVFRVVICIRLLFIYMYTVVDQLPRLGKRESKFFCCCLPVIMWFLLGEVSSSSGCLGPGLGWATLFYCGTP